MQCRWDIWTEYCCWNWVSYPLQLVLLVFVLVSAPLSVLFFFLIRSWVMWRKQERSWRLPLKKIRYLQTLCIISRRMKRVDENQSVPVIYSLDTLIFLSYQCWCGIKDTLDISTIALNKVPLMKSNHLSVALFLYNIEFFSSLG